jgi:amidohydrolase
MANKTTQRQIRALLPALIKIRHYLHQNPEPGYKEVGTAAIIERELISYGLDVRRIGSSGVVGLLAGQAGGKTVALRADMDALRLGERTKLPYRSVNSYMHACGHDGHTTALLGAANILAGMKDKIKGNVKFIFQPAEENGAGAKMLCDAGVMTKPGVDCIFALHGFPDHPLGSIALNDGTMMASWDRLEIKVAGRGGHGARPDEAIDPIVIAAQIVGALQTIVSRTVAPAEQAVISIATIHGGTEINVIPDHVELAGTIRTMDDAVRSKVLQAIRCICTHTAKAMGGSCVVKLTPGYPATVNTPAMADIVRQAGLEVLGAKNVLGLEKIAMVAEDFSYYLRHAPGCYFRLGLGDAAHRRPLHNSAFDFNDKALPLAIALLVNIAGLALERSIK